ncbi:MAG: molecular chaperone DnaK, partial [Thermodesulfobacteria bacterium]|nr:molecular chaperone DnaK [Thermodesulfobacteriota bacterium]
GLREMGLPYESDPAVTKHLARFLTMQGKGNLPDIILFNGGALKPGIIRERISSVLSAWKGDSVSDIQNESLDLAISVGAVYYGLVRMGLGLRVGGGIPRAYFIALSKIKGSDEGEKAVCLIERGTEEGEEVEIDRQFQVLTNRPVKFTLLSSTIRQEDHVGDIVQINDKEFVKLPPLQTVLKYGRRSQDKKIPVKLGSKVTTVGTLELYCRSLTSPHRWRLQFELRPKGTSKPQETYHVDGVRVAMKDAPKADGKGLTAEDQEALAEARKVIESCFSGSGSESVDPKELGTRLAEIFGMGKELWSMPILRGLADIFLDVKQGRKKSLMHEARWFNLTGFCMRPGFGDPADPWRMKKVWPLSFEGLANVRKLEARLQWWIFWRRVAGGLGTGQQNQLYSSISQVLVPSAKKGRRKKKAKLFKPVPEEARQMWLFAGNLERLEVEQKVALGDQAVASYPKSSFKKDLLWALGRIGARVPLYGPANRVVPPSKVVGWLEGLKKYEFKKELPALIGCVVSMARLCGDRARDLPEKAREDICVWLELLGARPEQVAPIRQFQELERDEQNRAFGEHLPEGLVLFEDESQGGEQQ